MTSLVYWRAGVYFYLSHLLVWSMCDGIFSHGQKQPKTGSKKILELRTWELLALQTYKKGLDGSGEDLVFLHTRSGFPLFLPM